MRVLGIDPGSVCTGYGIVDRAGAESLLHVCHGSISPGDRLPLPERLLGISARLREIIEEFRPQAVSIESVFFAKNANSALILGQARGAALLTAAGSGLPVFEYPPASVKQAVTGYGRATKEQVRKMVRLLLKAGPPAGASDASDALAIAICHLNSCKGLRVKAGGAPVLTKRPV